MIERKNMQNQKKNLQEKIIQKINVPYKTKNTTVLYKYYTWRKQMKVAKYFSATWCGPCKIFKPVMNEIVGEGYSVEFIDVDQHQDLAAKYGVRSIPVTVIEENGIEVDRFIGALPKRQVIERLSK